MNSGKKERKTSHYIFTNWNLIIFQNLERINRNMWKQKWSNIMHDTQFTDLTTVYLKLILFQIILTTSHNRGKMLQYYLPSTWLYAPWSIRRLQEMFKWFESFFFFWKKQYQWSVQEKNGQIPILSSWTGIRDIRFSVFGAIIRSNFLIFTSNLQNQNATWKLKNDLTPQKASHVQLANQDILKFYLFIYYLFFKLIMKGEPKWRVKTSH